jgi:hypothetical protein
VCFIVNLCLICVCLKLGFSLFEIRVWLNCVKLAMNLYPNWNWEIWLNFIKLIMHLGLISCNWAWKQKTWNSLNCY